MHPNSNFAIQISEHKPALKLLSMGGSNPEGRTIQVNQEYLLLDGLPWVPVMGEFHFSRYPVEEWEDELLKMKAGGITVAATYIFWIHIEEIESQFNWSGNNNLRYFIELCQKVGLFAYPRIGPWAHGECRNGGFPDWLLAKCGFDVRTDKFPYLDYVRRLYAEISRQLQGLLWKNGGPVIGIQIENELLNNSAHISTLKKIAQETGLDVPIYTMTGWGPAEIPEGEVIPVFGGYPDAFWDRQVDHWSSDSRKHYFFSSLRDDNTIGADLAKRQGLSDLSFLNQYPYGTCEIGGGMQASYHRRPLIEPDDIAALAMVKVGNGSNLQGYYMYHGGSNPVGRQSTLQESQDTQYPNDLPVIDYDFQAPLGEYGQIRDHYHLLRRLHLFLMDYGSLLAKYAPFLPDTQPDSITDNSTLRWAVRSDGSGGYLFINNYQRIEQLPDHDQVQFEINLPGETLRVPSEPVNISSRSYMFWPFNMDCSGILLKYATAQPVCKLEAGNSRYYVFSAQPDGAVEFAFDARTLSQDMDLDLMSPAADLTTRFIKGLKPGKDCLIHLTGIDGKKISILVLPQSLTAHLYKMHAWGSHYLMISEGSLIEKSGGISFQTARGGKNTISIFPDPPAAIQMAGKPVAWSRDGLFSELSVHLPEEPIPFSAQLLKTAGPARQVRPGPSGVAQAPTDSDFDAAETWLLSFSPDLLANMKNVILNIDYIGDVARAYIQDHLIDDDFYSGHPWEIGLSRFTEAIVANGLVLKILPLHKDSPIYLPESVPVDFSNSTDLVKVKSITLLPVYETWIGSNPAAVVGTLE